MQVEIKVLRSRELKGYKLSAAAERLFNILLEQVREHFDEELERHGDVLGLERQNSFVKKSSDNFIDYLNFVLNNGKGIKTEFSLPMSLVSEKMYERRTLSRKELEKLATKIKGMEIDRKELSLIKTFNEEKREFEVRRIKSSDTEEGIRKILDEDDRNDVLKRHKGKCDVITDFYFIEEGKTNRIHFHFAISNEFIEYFVYPTDYTTMKGSEIYLLKNSDQIRVYEEMKKFYNARGNKSGEKIITKERLMDTIIDSGKKTQFKTVVLRTLKPLEKITKGNNFFEFYVMYELLNKDKKVVKKGQRAEYVKLSAVRKNAEKKEIKLPVNHKMIVDAFPKADRTSVMKNIEELANYSTEQIKRNVEYTKKQKDVDNFFSYAFACIKRDLAKASEQKPVLVNNIKSIANVSSTKQFDDAKVEQDKQEVEARNKKIVARIVQYEKLPLDKQAEIKESARKLYFEKTGQEPNQVGMNIFAMESVQRPLIAEVMEKLG